MKFMLTFTIPSDKQKRNEAIARFLKTREAAAQRDQVVGTLDPRQFQQRLRVAGQRESAGLDRIRADVERCVGIDDRSGPGGSGSVGGVKARRQLSPVRHHQESTARRRLSQVGI
jgi:hypothetical protein